MKYPPYLVINSDPYNRIPHAIEVYKHINYKIYRGIVCYWGCHGWIKIGKYDKVEYDYFSKPWVGPNRIDHCKNKTEVLHKLNYLYKLDIPERILKILKEK